MQQARPPRTALAVLATAASLIQGLPALHAQDGRLVFKTSVTVVPITAVVRDSRRRTVRDLARDDFHVLENGVRRAIVDFRAADNAPLSVALLFDASGSMRGSTLETGRAVVNDLLTRLDPAADEVALFTFDNRLRQQTPFGNDRGSVRTALNAADAWGLTSMYDAIADTARRLAVRQHRRRALVVVTDGLDTASSLTASQVSAVASAIDVPVYIVAVSGGAGRDSDGDLSSLAYWTGGDVSRVTAPEDAGRAVGALMAALRQQYFLAIESAAAAGWYRLEVKTRRRDLTVRARTGYVASANRAE